MPTTTISPQVRIAALVGVLLIALAGSAFFLLRSHSTPATVTTPAPTQHQTTPTKHPHVVRPTVNPLFPTPVRTALMSYRLVVVGFYNPNSPTTLNTLAETRAGAAAAHVGFVSVNLLKDSVAGPLTALLPTGEVLPNPGFVIYRRPGTLAYRSDGYLDRVGVAQAVEDSR